MFISKCEILILLTLISYINTIKDWSADELPIRWNNEASQRINEILNRRLNGNIAKNVILFLGDGMGISTVKILSNSLDLDYIIK